MRARQKPSPYWTAPRPAARGYKGVFGLCPQQPYQNYLTNFLAQDSATHELPKFWQELVKKTSGGPLAAK
jgi:hypothetical protein